MMNGNPHSEDFQQYLIKQGTREQIIEWLQWNDHNGCYSDAESAHEGLSPLTREQAVELIVDQKYR
jgi:hypothetical protein